MKKNILVAHGGGPTPVMNSSLRGVIEGAREEGNTGKIFAARFGAEGILKDDLIDLTNLPESEVDLLSQTPASAIGSCRRKLSDADYPAVLETIKKHDINVLLYNGGNDSMDTCNKLSIMAQKSQIDLCVMGIPKTIDNDLAVTDHCPGYGSAARFAAQTAAEIGADASALPIHIVVTEYMGRDAGWITAAASMGQKISGCEMMTLLPENKLDIDTFLKDAEYLYKKGKGLVVAVSEGICGLDGNPIADSGIVDGFGHKVPGGASQRLSEIIMQRTGIKSRSEKPGLLGRCSMPYISLIDREEAYSVGKEAVKQALNGNTGYMIGIEADRGSEYKFRLFTIPLEKVANAVKQFPSDWMTGYSISDEFVKYCRPLIGTELPAFAHLR